MPTRTIPALSTEYVRARVTAKEAGVPVDPTGDDVEMAFVAAGSEPTAPDWLTGGWETDASVSPVAYKARVAVGPDGDITLPAGRYTAWVRIHDLPEVPVRRVGLLVVT